MKFIKKNTFYCIPNVYEFNLPSGHSCPFAKDCKVLVDRDTGKMDMIGKVFRCYSSAAERFPGVRKSRWQNFEDVKAGKEIEVPKDAANIRIHASGDFFSQAYFDQWLEVCRKNEKVKFWAFTKSVKFWVNRMDEIPDNLTLQASLGSHQDHLTFEHGLKYVQVFPTREAALESGLEIDTDDRLAMNGTASFALLDNFKNPKKKSKGGGSAKN